MVETSTQQRLLEAAVDVFGRYGYEAATTRKIAGEAGANIASIPYYYGGKEGLYRAVVSHIVGLLQARVGPQLQAIEAWRQEADGSRERPFGLLEELLGSLISFMIGSPDAPRVARIILREQLYPTSAYDMLFEGLLGRILDGIGALIGAATNESSERTAKLRAMAVMGQVLAFRVGRETIVRALGLEGYSPAEMEEIKSLVIEHTRAVLDGLGQGRKPAKKSVGDPV